MVLPAPLRPRTTTFAPLSTARSTPVNTSSDPYAFDRPSAVSGVRPHGAGFGKRIRATLSLRRSGSSPASSSSARRAMFFAATALVAFAPIFAACRCSADGLLLGVRALAAAALLVGRPRLLVAAPVHVVDVDLAAGGVEEPHLVDHRGEQLGVVADHDEPALVGGEERAQPGDRVGVEVVRGLVEQQRRRARRSPATAVGGREQDPGELDAAPLAARERLHRLVEHAVRQPEVRADPSGVALRGVPAERGEPLLDAPVLADRPVLRAVDQLGHPRLRLLHVAQQLVQPARREHPVLGGDREVALARVLRQVADRPVRGDRARVRLALAREHPHRGGLAGAVAADEADPVAGLHPQRGIGQEDAGPGTQFQVGRGDHGAPDGGRRQRAAAEGATRSGPRVQFTGRRSPAGPGPPPRASPLR